MSDDTMSSGAPTVVLVHGAFAESSSWSGVIERLQARGIRVTAAANPLRGITIDTAYVAGVFEEIRGPVLAVGHSYAGAIISAAATQAANVEGLVFVCAFAPEEGEVLGQVAASSKDSALMPALVPHQVRTATGGGPGTELVVDPARFHDVFASDLSIADAAVMAATQRPVADAAFSDPVGPQGWKSLPAWAVVATGDRAAGTDLTRSMAERAGAKITELDGSHVIMVSQPAAVTDVILAALAAIAPAHAMA